MSDRPLNLAIIIGSTREGRFGDTVGRWFATEAAGHGGFSIDLIDLAEIKLPPTHRAKPTAEATAFCARLSAADAFVIVTPEYNHSYPASLKHAIDQGYVEWMAKPVGFVSYGGTTGGVRAIEHLRNVFAELHATTIRDYVCFLTARRQFDTEGRPVDPDGPRNAAKTMLYRLAWWGQALRNAREAHPYVKR
ncbi:MAG TPA: NAD(P)H-dependent oxidoreductase [Dongiaceae bacterium]|jgi:NAD(P)H-dependent FMN reductase